MRVPAAPVESRPSRWLTLALLPLVALPAVFTVATLLWASGYGRGRPLDAEALGSVVFAAWALLPFLAMGAVVVVTARRVPGAVAAVALGVVALAVLTVVLLLGFITSESSTAALLFVFLPVYQLLVVLVTAVAPLVLHRILRRRRARRSPPQAPRG